MALLLWRWPQRQAAQNVRLAAGAETPYIKLARPESERTDRRPAGVRSDSFIGFYSDETIPMDD